jgi:uncharacterized membrane protein YfcA
MWGFLAVGIVAGLLSGLIGIGGGIIVVPALIYLFKFNQHQAQGTTLAMLVPPIGILAAYTYYKAGHANLPVAAILAVGFLAGGWLGGGLAEKMSDVTLARVFGVVLLGISVKMILTR